MCGGNSAGQGVKGENSAGAHVAQFFEEREICGACLDHAAAVQGIGDAHINRGSVRGPAIVVRRISSSPASVRRRLVMGRGGFGFARPFDDKGRGRALYTHVCVCMCVEQCTRGRVVLDPWAIAGMSLSTLLCLSLDVPRMCGVFRPRCCLPRPPWALLQRHKQTA